MKNKAGKTGTKTVFLKFLRTGITKIDKILLGNKGKQEKNFGGTREHDRKQTE